MVCVNETIPDCEPEAVFEPGAILGEPVESGLCNRLLEFEDFRSSKDGVQRDLWHLWFSQLSPSEAELVQKKLKLHDLKHQRGQLLGELVLNKKRVRGDKEPGAWVELEDIEVDIRELEHDLEHSRQSNVEKWRDRAFELSKTVEDSELQGARDHGGHIRLAYLKDIVEFSSESDRARIIKGYVSWVSEDEFFVLRRTERLKGRAPGITYHALKCSKRGNDVHAKAIRGRVAALTHELERSGAIGGQHTNVLYFTLTYDTKLCTIEEAWKQMGKEWNRFMACVRKEYGAVSTIRTWESFENGFPHVHSVLLFHDYRFVVVRDQSGAARIPRCHKNKISAWWHSWVDIFAIDNGRTFNECMTDVLWYVLKLEAKAYQHMEKWKEKEVKSLAYPWYFGLRNVAISGRFVKWLADLITTRLKVTQTTGGQLDLEGELATTIEWEFLGMISAEKAGFGPEIWEKEYGEPPPWIAETWIPSKMRSRISAWAGMASAFK